MRRPDVPLLLAVLGGLPDNDGLEILKRAYAEGIASGAPRELNAEETLAAYKVRFRSGVSQRCAPTVEEPHRAALDAALARGLADAEADRTSDLDEAIAKLNKALGLPGEIRKA